MSGARKVIWSRFHIQGPRIIGVSAYHLVAQATWGLGNSWNLNPSIIEICGLLGYYTASCGNYLPTFRDNVSVPSSRVKIPSRKASLCAGSFPSTLCGTRPMDFRRAHHSLLLVSPPFPLQTRAFFLSALAWSNHSDPSRLQVTSKFRLGHGGKIPSSCELVGLESLGGRRGPRSSVLVGLSPTAMPRYLNFGMYGDK
jgi:hypothetical protein